ncbi:hypothetical protein O3P69_015112 [Scylla paramamosain]|uniref:RING-type domain-containing protein n=1 Tax=Scylla paramamosain TaxID=85552 RepID=A0AAW0T371_SCYPA
MIDRGTSHIRNREDLERAHTSPSPGPLQPLGQKYLLENGNCHQHLHYHHHHHHQPQQQQPQQQQQMQQQYHQYSQLPQQYILPPPQHPQMSPPQQAPPSLPQEPLQKKLRVFPTQQPSVSLPQQSLQYLPHQSPLLIPLPAEQQPQQQQQQQQRQFSPPHQSFSPPPPPRHSVVPEMLCNVNHHHHQEQQSQHHHHLHHHYHQHHQQSNTTNPSTLYSFTQQPPRTNTSSPTQETETQRALSPTATHHPTAKDIAALKEERARLHEKLVEMKERRRCVVCLDNEYGAIFMPCTHLVTCPSCAATLTACPLCRTPVQYLVAVKVD